jgi:voltage-gated potassium channel
VASTVGFGDITPDADAARLATMVQMVADLLVVGLVVRVILGAVKEGRERRDAGPAGNGG